MSGRFDKTLMDPVLVDDDFLNRLDRALLKCRVVIDVTP